MFRLAALRNLSLTAGAAAASTTIFVYSPTQTFSEEASSSQPPATCPVAFMWRWTGAIKLPFNHPPVEEVRANFNEQHYPKGQWMKHKNFTQHSD